MNIDLVSSEVETPENCKPVDVFATYRFNHYKEGSSQFKRGIKGRWQEFNGYGWSNVEAPESWIKGFLS